MNFLTGRCRSDRSHASGWSFARLAVIAWLVFLTGSVTVLGSHTHLDDGQDAGSSQPTCALCLVQQVASAACVVPVAKVELPPVLLWTETARIAYPVLWSVAVRSSVSSRAPPAGMFPSP